MLRDRTISLNRSIGAEELELVLAPTTASLLGTLVGAGDAAGSHVIALISMDGADSQLADSPVRLTRPDNKNTYLFTNCAAGSYVLVVLRDFDPSDLEDESVLNGLRRSPAAVPVTLSVGSETRLDVRVGGH